MPIIAKYSKKEFTVPPEGLFPAVCVDVVDLGLQQTGWGESHRVELRWQLEDHDPKTERPFLICQRYTLSLHEKSRLRPMLEAWRGKKFDAAELEHFDLERLIGANCQLQLAHTLKADGEVFANVQVCIPAAKGAPKLRVSPDYVCAVERRWSTAGDKPARELVRSTR